MIIDDNRFFILTDIAYKRNKKHMNTKRLSINLISNIVQFAISLIISFFFTPYFVSAVGEVGYSFYSIACTCISYFTVITSAVTSMASRHITIAYHNGEKEKVQQYYSTVFYATSLISFLLGIIIVIFVCRIDSLLDIPPELVASVQILFLLVLFSGLIATVCSVFSLTVFCFIRLDIKSIALIIISVIKVAVLVVLLYFFEADIVYLGISYSVSVVLEALFYYFSTKKLMPEIIVKPKYFRKELVSELVGVGIWNSINQVNTILLNGLDLIIANVFVSSTLAGALSISKTIPNQLVTLILMLANIYLPSLTIAYAKKNKDELMGVFKTSFDILGFGTSIVIAGFIASGRQFFELWMPTINTNVLYWTSILAMLPLVFNASTQAMGNAALLAAKLKMPVLITFGRGVVGVALIFVLVKATSLGVFAIVGVSSCFTILYDLLFSTPYAAYCSGLKKSFFYKSKLKFILNVAILSAVFLLVLKLVPITGWGLFIIIAVGCAVFGAIFNFFYYFNRDSRKAMLHRIKSVLIKGDKK